VAITFAVSFAEAGRLAAFPTVFLKPLFAMPKYGGATYAG